MFILKEEKKATGRNTVVIINWLFITNGCHDSHRCRHGEIKFNGIFTRAHFLQHTHSVISLDDTTPLYNHRAAACNMCSKRCVNTRRIEQLFGKNKKQKCK